MKKPIYIFHHIRKTGGTTFNNHLYNHLSVDEEVVHFGPAGNQWREKREKQHWADRPLQERERARILIGHDVYWGIHDLLPGREPRYMTFIREPADQLVSLYNYSVSKRRVNTSFEEWLHSASLMSREFRKQLRGKISSKEFMQRCWYVGTTQTLDLDIAVVSRFLNIPDTGWHNVRVAGSNEAWVLDGEVEQPIEKLVEVSADLKNRVAQLYPEEYDLYKLALQLREDRYQKLSNILN